MKTSHLLTQQNIYLIIAFFFLFMPVALTADVEKVLFYNSGKIFIGDKPKIALHIPSAVRLAGSEMNIVLERKTVVAGNFFQDSPGNVLDPASDGTFIFRNGDEGQTITCSPCLIDNFDRGQNYVAFPVIKMDKNSKLIIPPRMGIDALSVQRPGTRTGVLYLQSASESSAAGAGIYDASLRITGNNQPESGCIIVERYVEGYRGETFPQCALFPFATPLNGTQRTGYYAGTVCVQP